MQYKIIMKVKQEEEKEELVKLLKKFMLGENYIMVFMMKMVNIQDIL